MGHARKQGRYGGEQTNQQGHTGGKQQGNLLAAGLCQTFGQHLGKQVDDQRGHNGAVDDIFFRELPQHQQGGQRRAAGVEDVVADENGDERLVEPLADPQGFFRSAVALVDQRTQAYLADGGVGRFTAGEICGAQQEETVQYTTGRVHEKTNSFIG